MFSINSKKLFTFVKNKTRYCISIALRIIFRFPIAYILIRNLVRVVAPKFYARIYSFIVSGPLPKYRVSVLGVRAGKIYSLQKHLNSKKRSN